MQAFTPDDYRQYAAQAASRWGINPDVFTAQIQQESGFNPNAQNGNATGIAQFMPKTASSFGLDPTDPYASLDAAAQYDAQLLGATGGDYMQMLTRYGTLSNDPSQNNGPGSDIYSKFGGMIGGGSPGETVGGGSAGDPTPQPTYTPENGYIRDFANWINSWVLSGLAIFVGVAFIYVGLQGVIKK